MFTSEGGFTPLGRPVSVFFFQRRRGVIMERGEVSIPQLGANETPVRGWLTKNSVYSIVCRTGVLIADRISSGK